MIYSSCPVHHLVLSNTSDGTNNATDVARERHCPHPHHVTIVFILATINRNVDSARDPPKNATNIQYKKKITGPQSSWRHPKGMALRTTHDVGNSNKPYVYTIE